MKFHKQFIKKMIQKGFRRFAQIGQEVVPGQENQIIPAPPVQQVQQVRQPDASLVVDPEMFGVDLDMAYKIQDFIQNNANRVVRIPPQWKNDDSAFAYFGTVANQILGDDPAATWLMNAMQASESRFDYIEQGGASIEGVEGRSGIGNMVADPSAKRPEEYISQKEEGIEDKRDSTLSDRGAYEAEGEEGMKQAIDKVHKELLDRLDDVSDIFEKMTSLLEPEKFNPGYARRSKPGNNVPGGIRETKSLDIIESYMDVARKLIQIKMDDLKGKAKSKNLPKELAKWSRLGKFVKPQMLQKQLAEVGERKKNIVLLSQKGLDIDQVAQQSGTTPGYVKRVLHDSKDLGAETWSHYEAYKPEYQPGYEPGEGGPAKGNLKPEWFNEDVGQSDLENNNSYIAARLKSRFGEKWEELARPYGNEELHEILKPMDKETKWAVFGPDGWLPIDKGFMLGKRPIPASTLKNIWDIFLGRPMPEDVKEEYNKKLLVENNNKKKIEQMSNNIILLSNIQRKFIKVASRSVAIDEIIRNMRSQIKYIESHMCEEN